MSAAMTMKASTSYYQYLTTHQVHISCKNMLENTIRVQKLDCKSRGKVAELLFPDFYGVIEHRKTIPSL